MARKIRKQAVEKLQELSYKNSKEINKIIIKSPFRTAVTTLTAVIAVFEASKGDYLGVLHCFSAALLYYAPDFVEKLGISLPKICTGIILMFVFFSQVVGEALCGYILIPQLDTGLHLTSGFIFAAIGFGLVSVLKSYSAGADGAALAAAFAICFSITTGVVWELLEFSADRILGTDMQKDTLISEFSTVYLDSSLSNIPIKVQNIEATYIDGEGVIFNGYLDIGLYDTMKDLTMNFIGAAVFGLIGYAYAAHGRMGKVARAFLPYPT